MLAALVAGTALNVNAHAKSLSSKASYDYAVGEVKQKKPKKRKVKKASAKKSMGKRNNGMRRKNSY